MNRQAILLDRHDMELLRGSKEEVPTWDSHVLDHLNYQDAYGGEADEIYYMAHAIAEVDDIELANEIADDLKLWTFEPAVPDDDPEEVWNDLVQALARAHYPTWRRSGLPAGQYDLGILDGEFGFVFHADEEDVYQLREQLYGQDDEPLEASVKTAARLPVMSYARELYAQMMQDDATCAKIFSEIVTSSSDVAFQIADEYIRKYWTDDYMMIKNRQLTDLGAKVVEKVGQRLYDRAYYALKALQSW